MENTKLTIEDLKLLSTRGTIKYAGKRSARMGKDLFERIKTGAKNAYVKAVDAVKAGLQATGDFIVDKKDKFVDGVTNAARTVKTGLQATGDFIVDKKDKFVDGVTNAARTVKDFGSTTADKFRDYYKEELEGTVSRREDKYQNRLDRIGQVDLGKYDEDYIEVLYDMYKSTEKKKDNVRKNRRLYIPAAIVSTMKKNHNAKVELRKQQRADRKAAKLVAKESRLRVDQYLDMEEYLNDLKEQRDYLQAEMADERAINGFTGYYQDCGDQLDEVEYEVVMTSAKLESSWKGLSKEEQAEIIEVRKTNRLIKYQETLNRVNNLREKIRVGYSKGKAYSELMELREQLHLATASMSNAYNQLDNNQKLSLEDQKKK